MWWVGGGVGLVGVRPPLSLNRGEPPSCVGWGARGWWVGTQLGVDVDGDRDVVGMCRLAQPVTLGGVILEDFLATLAVGRVRGVLRVNLFDVQPA